MNIIFPWNLKGFGPFVLALAKLFDAILISHHLNRPTLYSVSF